MERYEMFNSVLKPIDAVVEQSLTGLKKVNMYEPFKKGMFGSLRHALLSQFKLVNDLKIEGAENVPSEGGVILAMNHSSWLDAQVVSVTSPRKVSFLAKADFVDWPLLRHMIELSDGIFVRRGGDDETLNVVADRLKQGACVAIFPEGTIPGEEDWARWDVDPTTGLLRGRTGVARLAMMANVPVVPVGLSGCSKAFPPEAYPRMERLPLPIPAPVKVKFGKPITFDVPADGKLEYETLRKNTDKVMHAISELVDFSMGFEPVSLPIPVKDKPTSLPPMAYRSKPVTKKKPLGMLILHSFTSDVACVSDLRFPAEELGLPYRVPVLRGHGTRWQDLRGVKRQDWYEDGENALLDLLTECDRVIIAGLSMGGLVALDLAAHYNSKVAAVVSIAAALKFADPLAFMTPVLATVVPSWPSPNAYHDKELAKKNNKNYPKFPPKAFMELYAYSHEMENRLSFVRCPALVLQSKVDQVVAPKAGQAIYDKISSKAKKIVWFEKSGHEMMLDMEAPLVTQTIVDYVKAVIKEGKTN